MENYSLIGDFNKKEKMRVEALRRGDNLTYRRLCDELGIEPESLDSYGFGIIEEDLKKECKLERVVRSTDVDEPLHHGPDYEGFLREVSSRSLGNTSFGHFTEIKIELLKKYFPKRFQDDEGTQFLNSDVKRLEDYDENEVGSIFNKLLRFAVKKR